MSKLKKRKVSSPPLRTSSRQPPSRGAKSGAKAALKVLGAPDPFEITPLPPTPKERVAAEGLLDIGSSLGSIVTLSKFPTYSKPSLDLPLSPSKPKPTTQPSLKVIAAKGATMRTSQHIDSSKVLCKIPQNEQVKLIEKVWMDPDDVDVVGIYRLNVVWKKKEGWISDRGEENDLDTHTQTTKTNATQLILTLLHLP